jgi:hypothetical protein
MWHAWERRENCIKLLEAKLEGKRPLGRPKHRWEFGIKMNRKKIGWGVWIGFG